MKEYKTINGTIFTTDELASQLYMASLTIEGANSVISQILNASSGSETQNLLEAVNGGLDYLKNYVLVKMVPASKQDVGPAQQTTHAHPAVAAWGGASMIEEAGGEMATNANSQEII